MSDPVQVALQSQVVRGLRGLGLDIAWTTARNGLVLAGVLGAVALSAAGSLLAEHSTARGPLSIDGRRASVFATVLLLWWLVVGVRAWGRASAWAGRPAGGWDPALRLPQSSVGCDVRSVMLVEVVGPGLVAAAPPLLLSVALVVGGQSAVDRPLLALAMTAGALLLVLSWRRALERLLGGGGAADGQVRLGTGLVVAVSGGLLTAVLSSTSPASALSLDLPRPWVLAASLLLCLLLAHQAGRVLGAVDAATGLPLVRPVEGGPERHVPRPLALDEGELGSSRWSRRLLRRPLVQGARSCTPLLVLTTAVLCSPPLAEAASSSPLVATVAGFLLLSSLSALSAAAPDAENLLTSGRSHRMLYEVTGRRWLGWALLGRTEAVRVVCPALLAVLLWSQVWPQRWYVPIVIALAVVAGCLLADGLAGGTSTSGASEMRQVVYASVVLAVGVAAWQLVQRSPWWSLAAIAAVLLVSEELWTHKVQRLQSS